jgi:hypothetical protein
MNRGIKNARGATASCMTCLCGSHDRVVVLGVELFNMFELSPDLLTNKAKPLTTIGASTPQSCTISRRDTGCPILLVALPLRRTCDEHMQWVLSRP